MPSVPVPPIITNGCGSPMQTTSCTWPYVVPVGEDPAAHGHWCAFTDLCHAMPCQAVGNMKLFNNHSGSRGLPCLAEGIYWATGLSLTTPFTEGRPGVNDKASPPGRHQEQAPEQRCTFSPTAFSSVQESSSGAARERFLLLFIFLMKKWGVTNAAQTTGHFKLIIKPCHAMPCPQAARTCCTFGPTSFSSVRSCFFL